MVLKKSHESFAAFLAKAAAAAAKKAAKANAAGAAMGVEEGPRGKRASVLAAEQLESIKIVFREYAPALGRTATGSHHLDPPGIVTVIPEWPLRIIRGSVSRGLAALIILPPSVISDSSSSSDDVEEAEGAEVAEVAAAVVAGAVAAGGGLGGKTAFSAIIDSKRPRKKLSDIFDSYI